MTAPPDRRTQIADTVIQVLAEAGARGLTHRAVDAAAGLPAGSASYYFRSRDALLVAAAQRLADLDLAAAGAPVAVASGPAELAQLLAGLVHAQTTTFRDRTRARYHLSLNAQQYPQVKALLDELGQRFLKAAML